MNHSLLTQHEFLKKVSRFIDDIEQLRIESDSAGPEQKDRCLLIKSPMFAPQPFIRLKASDIPPGLTPEHIASIFNDALDEAKKNIYDQVELTLNHVEAEPM